MIKWRWSANIIDQVVLKSFPKFGVSFGSVIDMLKLFQCRHQGFRDKASPVNAKMSAGIWVLIEVFYFSWVLNVHYFLSNFINL